MMVDYSTQDPAKRWGAHTESIDLEDFSALLPDLARHNADVMLEIKDKEQSALRANALLVPTPDA
jgi:UV DNA damage endonuclease